VSLKIRRPQGLTSSSLVSGTSEVVEEFRVVVDASGEQNRRGRYLGASPKSRPLPREPPRLLRVDEAAELLTISGRHLRGLIARGEVNVVRLGRCVRIPRAEVDRLCAGGG
jgi:excisionase family DNA binding protein